MQKWEYYSKIKSFHMKTGTSYPNAYQQLKIFSGSDRLSISAPKEPVSTKVWNTLQTIPYGETWSYLQMAKAIGNPKACRAVGMANHRNPIGIIIPCHRVIGSNGNLVGYASGLDMKRYLLNLEKETLLKQKKK
ncbi:MAG: methylated-DNA--[protein]-cysteine S-methyltransferase [Acutalibacteraceae bacterium]